MSNTDCVCSQNTLAFNFEWIFLGNWTNKLICSSFPVFVWLHVRTVVALFIGWCQRVCRLSSVWQISNHSCVRSANSQWIGVSSATATDINEIDIFVGRLILLLLLVDVPITQLTVPDDNSFTRKPFNFPSFFPFRAYLVSGQMVVVWNDTLVYRECVFFRSTRSATWKESISYLVWCALGFVSVCAAHQVAPFNCIIFVRVRLVVKLWLNRLPAKPHYSQSKICDISCLPSADRQRWRMR